MSSHINPTKFQQLIELCSDLKSEYNDIDDLYSNILCTNREEPEFSNTIIMCYSQLTNRADFNRSDFSRSGHAIEILIKNERYDMIHLHFIKCREFDLIVADYVTEYSFKHSKISILKLLIHDLIEYTKINRELRRVMLCYIKEKILFYFGLYDHSYSDIAELIIDLYPVYPAPMYFQYLLQGACAGDHLESVKCIMSNPDFDTNNSVAIKSCMGYASSFDIIKLLHDHEPEIAVNGSFFHVNLSVTKRFDIIDWIIDNNVKVDIFGSDYILALLDRYRIISMDIFLYFIVHKKLPVSKHHLTKALYHNGHFNFLILFHYYIPGDVYFRPRENIHSDIMDMYLSLYLSTYDKDKMTNIWIRTPNSKHGQYVSANTYMDQYKIARREFHEELQLLFDLPIDLCRQIL